MSVAEKGSPAPLTFALLRLLADGDFHSGERMARSLGVSRASVHNALHGIEQYGLTLYRVRGRGYRLAQPIHWLDAGAVGRFLGDRQGRIRLEVMEHAASSNALLLQRAAQGEEGGTVLAVEWQSAGRGRLGRTWHSGLGGGLTFSLLWRFAGGLSALSGLSLAVGVAIVRALRELGVHQAGLKWPNDIMLPEGKLAGILLESQGDMLGPCAVVVGVGMNLALPEVARQRIGQASSDLLGCGITLRQRNQVLGLLLKHLADMLPEFASQGFAPLRAEWESYHVFQQRRVRLLVPDGRSVEGVALGVTGEGALRLADAQGEQVWNAGDISLREA